MHWICDAVAVAFVCNKLRSQPTFATYTQLQKAQAMFNPKIIVMLDYVVVRS